MRDSLAGPGVRTGRLSKKSRIPVFNLEIALD